MAWVFSDAEEGKDFSFLTFGVRNMRNETRNKKAFEEKTWKNLRKTQRNQLTFLSVYQIM